MDSEDFIQRRPLGCGETGIMNQLNALPRIGGIHEICGGVDVFFLKRTAKIVGTKVERNLARLFPLRKPGRARACL